MKNTSLFQFLLKHSVSGRLVTIYSSVCSLVNRVTSKMDKLFCIAGLKNKEVLLNL